MALRYYILDPMEYTYGIDVIKDNLVHIEKHDASTYYTYVVVAKHISDRSGNGFAELQFNDMNNNKPKDLQLFGWRIESRISVPFDWSGSTIYPKMIDPTGSVRQIYADPYSKTIYKGLKYADDIQAVFNTLVQYSRYQSWSEYDVECAVREKETVILELQERIRELENQVAEYQK